MVHKTHPHVTLEEETNAVELARACERRAQFDRNAAWLQANAAEVYSKFHGKCICIAGQEVFAAETAGEALKLAETAHPEDRGRFVHYVPLEKVPRICDAH